MNTRWFKGGLIGACSLLMIVDAGAQKNLSRVEPVMQLHALRVATQVGMVQGTLQVQQSLKLILLKRKLQLQPRQRVDIQVDTAVVMELLRRLVLPRPVISP
jgi:hypothetical protein